MQLERNVARKDREIAALTAELRALSRPAGNDAGPEKSGGHSSAEGSGDAPPHGRDFARLCLKSQVARLSQLAAMHDLRNADPTGATPHEYFCLFCSICTRPSPRVGKCPYHDPIHALRASLPASLLPLKLAKVSIFNKATVV